MDIEKLHSILAKKYPVGGGVPGGFKLILREDGDAYIYRPSPDGDGWFLEKAFDTFAEFLYWVENQSEEPADVSVPQETLALLLREDYIGSNARATYRIKNR